MNLVVSVARKPGVMDPAEAYAGFEEEIDEESHETYLENVPTGALTLLFVDVNTRQIIWGAQAVGDIQETPDRETSKQRLDYAITQMIAKLP